MKEFTKGDPPQALASYMRGGEPWGELTATDREQLVRAMGRDQLGLCAYCVGDLRIRDDPALPLPEVKVEHFFPRHPAAPEVRDPSLDYAWRNLLLCCIGAEGSQGKLQHCDTSKGNQVIRVSPLVHGIEGRFKYVWRRSDRECEIVGLDDAAKGAVSILNLNSPLLLRLRSSALERIRKTFISRIKRSKSVGGALNALWLKRRNAEFSPAVRHWINKKRRARSLPPV